ncbi:hypothetical protein INR49_014964 [Caranx melampygus]|nr:hypothetical protein INR49_014964 [Caranx melampygus]
MEWELGRGEELVGVGNTKAKTGRQNLNGIDRDTPLKTSYSHCGLGADLCSRHFQIFHTGGRCSYSVSNTYVPSSRSQARGFSSFDFDTDASFGKEMI